MGRFFESPPEILTDRPKMAHLAIPAALAGFGAYKMYQAYTEEEGEGQCSHVLRQRGVVDALTSGMDPKIGFMSDKQFEKSVSRNSILREHEEEFRVARKKS